MADENGQPKGFGVGFASFETPEEAAAVNAVDLSNATSPSVLRSFYRLLKI